MQKQLIFMFSGQGSQYFHMGKELYEKNPTFRYWMDKLNRFSKEIIKESIIDIIFDPTKSKADIFNHLLHSNLAIFILQYSLAQVLLTIGIKPDYVMGSSLGEIVSLAISEVISYEEGISTSIKLSEYMNRHCIEGEGGMLAILYDHRHYSDNPEVYKDTTIAAINFDSHYIISGRNHDLNRIKNYLDKKNIITQLLPVSFPFHSHLTKPIEPFFLDYLKQKIYKIPKIQIVSCSRIGLQKEIRYEYINDAIQRPIEFQKTIQFLEKDTNHIYIDLGPSGTLTTYVKYILPKGAQSETYGILNPFGRDIQNLNKLTELFD